jgi:hypothetical protein
LLSFETLVADEATDTSGDDFNWCSDFINVETGPLFPIDGCSPRGGTGGGGTLPNFNDDAAGTAPFPEAGACGC